MTDKSKHIPAWGWLVLIPGFLFLVLLFSLAGADFVISTANWKDALIWSVLLFFGWAFVLWVSHIRSPDLSLFLSALLWVCIIVGSQWSYYQSHRSAVVRYQLQGNEELYQNSQLEQNKIYNLYMQEVLNDPSINGWWGHIKLVMHEGIINHERLGSRKTGGRFAEVERSGWNVILAWLVSYIFLACACLLGLVGAAIRDPQKKQQNNTEHQHNPDVTSKITEKAKVKPYGYRPMTPLKTEKFEPQTIAGLIGSQNQELIKSLIEDLVIVSNFYNKNAAPYDVGKSRKKVIEDLKQKYRPVNQNRDPYGPEFMMMHSAFIVQQHLKLSDYYRCLKKITVVYKHFNLSMQIPLFQEIDLSGLVYKSVTIDPLWSNLFGKGANFYDQGSAWELIEEELAEDIPEGAYMAILYQSIHNPDPRVYEGWYGNDPYSLVQKLGPRLRDAILTYLHDWPIWFPEHDFYRLERLAAFVGQWPENIATPIIERCIKSGWRNSCSQIPETQIWIEFLDSYEPTPFGSLKSSIRWYEWL